jgi:hypothetical protein
MTFGFECRKSDISTTLRFATSRDIEICRIIVLYNLGALGKVQTLNYPTLSSDFNYSTSSDASSSAALMITRARTVTTLIDTALC